VVVGTAGIEETEGGAQNSYERGADGPSNGQRSGPFVGTRILEVTSTVAGQTAGMLLADLGADVARVVDPDSLAGPWDPGQRCWDHSKLRVPIAHAERAGSEELRRLVHAADVVLTDVNPSQLGPLGLEPETCFTPDGDQIHVWLPPLAASGPFSELPGDPLLIGALGGFATHHAASENRPVASAVPLVSYLHGALGAAATAAALVARERSGSNQAVVVTGLNAMGAALGTIMIEGLDLETIFSVKKGLRPGPSFRLYKTGDGVWIFLASLSPELFFRALDALGRIDLMVRPDVAGEFTNLMIPEVAAAVAAELETTFLQRAAEEWLTILREADVPAAPVSSREEWMDSEVVRANGGRLDLVHPQLGKVVVPGVPVKLSETPGAVSHLPDGDHVAAASTVWTDPMPGKIAPSWSRRPGSLPLEGLRVVDMSTFLAAPMASALLADAGADVIRVEAPVGDPYRVFTLSYLFANQRKRTIALDLRKPEGRSALFELIKRADVLINNHRPASLERLGLDDELIATINPNLISCSVSAFGQDGAAAGLPGFDPIMQVLSGLATAQGGDGEPVTTAAPCHDATTGVIAALGILGALFVRERTGRPQKVSTSLAAVSTLLQSAELTSYEGRPTPAQGGFDYPGPTPTHRFYGTADGWLAIAATSDAEISSLLDVVGHPEWGKLTDEVLTDRLSEAIRQRRSAEWVHALDAAAVPACPVLDQEGELDDPVLMANGFSHVVLDPVFGRIRIARGYADWVGAGPPPAAAGRAIGSDTRAVLSELEMSPAKIDELIESGAAAQSP